MNKTPVSTRAVSSARTHLRRRVASNTTGPSMTKQSFKDECDINRILNQFQRTGIVNHITQRQPQYLDLPSNVDYQSSMNTIIQAQQIFADLPALVRDHFQNDPARFLRAFSDEKQHDKLREFGFLREKVASQHPTALSAAGTQAAPSQAQSPSASSPGGVGGTGEAPR